MGIFDGGPFDFNGDGMMDGMEWMMGLQLIAGSRREAIELTGDDTFYMGSNELEDEDFEDDFDENDEFFNNLIECE